jgi:simple sugar transport system ATP-binding protein
VAGAAPATGPLLELRQVVKRFPGVLALDGVDFALHAGEVHALLGENGAGKSTLLSLLAGLQRPDAGTLLLHGAPIVLDSPAAARRHGIGVVQQHSTLVPSLTIAENLLLGGGPALRRPDRRAVSARFVALCQGFGLAIDPARLAGGLSLGEQQLAEIVRALWHGGRGLALDEPTAMLTPAGTAQLLDILRRLRAAGTAVLLITHKLDEALDVADRITVLRRGRVAGRFVPGERPLRERLLAAMFGDAAPAPSVAGKRAPGGDVLRVQNLTLAAALDTVSLAIAAGEILGIAGIDGNGQTQLAEILAGQRAADSGTTSLNGTDLAGIGVAARHRLGLRYVTDDRLGEGTVAAFPVAHNLLLKRIGAAPFWRHGVARSRAMANHAASLIAAYDIRASGPWAPVGTLSGGNVQKLLLARELDGTPRVVIYNKPMHGLDAMTQAAIRRRIAAQAAAGVACLLISPDLDELLLLSDRIGVLREGRLLGPLPNGPGARHAVAALMAGGA